VSKLNHPSAERLQAFVEDTLPGAEHAVVHSHLTHCAECQTEVTELRSLFEALGGLPVFEPNAGFADRVMAGVRVRQSAWAGAWSSASAWVDRVTPQSTRGWAAAAAVFALPVIGATVLVSWLLAQPGVSVQGLWTATAVVLENAAVGASEWVWAQMSTSVLAVWAARAVEFLGSVGRGEIGLALVMFAALTAGSIYILYQNLFRTQQQRRIEHASFVL
jgi:anti-sigma factor RsiW